MVEQGVSGALLGLFLRGLLEAVGGSAICSMCSKIQNMDPASPGEGLAGW
jgi:hypothetical protein